MSVVSVVVFWARVDDAAQVVGASHRLALLAASTATGMPARTLSLAHLCPQCGSTSHGTPSVAGVPVAVSLSRTEGAVAAMAAVGASVSGLGIDLESEGRAAPGLRGVVLSPSELALRPYRERPVEELRTWVRKEALLKALGTGLSTDPRSITLDGTAVTHGPPGPWWVRDLPLAPGLLATVAVRGVATATLSVCETTAS